MAVGYSAASYKEVEEAVRRGLSKDELHHRLPGAVGATLTCDEMSVQLNVDFVHLHPAVMKIAVRARGVERCMLITDAMRAAELAEGEYELSGQRITMSQGVARLTHGQSLAGSVLTMDQALRNFMHATGLSLVEALPMATSVPARSAWSGNLVPSCLDIALIWWCSIKSARSRQRSCAERWCIR